jgi:P-type Ca2+ transporter type 2C
LIKKEESMQWHQKEVETVIESLGSSLQGLTTGEAQRRLEEIGPNELIEKKKKTWLAMFLDQFKDFMILVLMAAALISGIIGEPSDTIAIVVIIILNAVIGFIQEYRAEQAMAALKNMAASNAVVLRDQEPIQIPAARIVPGDIIFLEAGNVVPADLRLTEGVQLKVEEATLTGESVPAEKHLQALPDQGLPLGDRKNMVYKGTFVTYGRGTGIVVSTGMETELGRIAAMLRDEEEVKTPLQKRLAGFGQKLAMAVLAICALIFIVGLLRSEPPLLMLLTAISLAVAAIPEALPAVVTISLALGAKKLVKQNALIRKLFAVETLGSVTYICSDKTGTLTLNKMTVEEMVVDGKTVSSSEFGAWNSDGKPFILDWLKEDILPSTAFLTALALSNDAQADKDGNLIGDPTELALFNFAGMNGFIKKELEKLLPRIGEIPFDADRKCMTTVHHYSNSGGQEPGTISFTKGAVDVLLDKSDHILTSEGLSPLDKNKFNAINEKMADQGLRVIGVAMRRWTTLLDRLAPEFFETGLTFLGLVGLLDPPREEVKQAISVCKSAGIIPVMITGDHPVTARAIALRLGIIEDGSKAIMTGRELEQLSSEEFEKNVEQVRVYARVAPEQKLKIVKALQHKGQFIAMTGDGVNDAPALKRADIGIAMGITGTDVSKEAAHLILLDDNFATIVKAVKEGRKIFDNIRKFIKYLLTTNSGEIWTLFLAQLVGLPIPLLPIHILWVNLVTDGLPALALSVEPEEGDVMKRLPRHPKESIFAQGLGLQAIWAGLLMGATVLFVQAWFLNDGNGHWQTMVFTVLCLLQLGNVMAIRSEKESLFSQGLFSNKPLLGAVALTFTLQMATIYVPFLNLIFKTTPLTFGELMITLVLSTTVFWAVEVEKWVKRKKLTSKKYLC